jgi:hypothetical protein
MSIIDKTNKENSNNNISKDIVNNEYYYIKKVRPPILDDNIKTFYKNIIDKINISNKLKKKKTIFVGVIKFKDNEDIEYIHCPLIGIDDKISIGVCNHFESIKNDSVGKKYMASHKY